MQKRFTGYCPAQGKDYTISIEYIDTSDFSQKSYEKGIAHCDYNMYGDKCDIQMSYYQICTTEPLNIRVIFGWLF